MASPTPQNRPKQTDIEENVQTDAATLLLLADVKAGVRGAFSKLYEQYKPLLHECVSSFYVRHFGAREENLSELEQEGCIALYKAALSYREGHHTTFGLYAKICMRNAFVSYLRRYDRDAAGEPVSSVTSVTQEGIDPAEQMVRRESYAALLARFTAMLSPLEKSVFSLCHSDLSRKAMAEKLGISEKSLDNALCRVRKKLRMCLS